jgi:hypothetical protein
MHSRIPFAYKRASIACHDEAGCPVCEQTGEAIELLFGSGRFRAQRRLTAFGRARNIIRIRTRCPVTATRYDRARLNSFYDASLLY